MSYNHMELYSSSTVKAELNAATTLQSPNQDKKEVHYKCFHISL